jgi:3-keto steroid reductase
VPASRPQLLAIPAHLRDQAAEQGSTQYIPSSSPVTLTLILACRSGKKAAEAKQHLEQKHEAELYSREQSGQKVKEGWREGLQIVWESLDMDAVGGSDGVLGFSERLKQK